MPRAGGVEGRTSGDRGGRGRDDVECLVLFKVSQENITMLRQMSFTTRALAMAATLALPTIALAQADNRPVVVVFRFTNSSFGPGAADFAGTETGVQDLLITELAGNNKVRVVDRAHLAEIMTEQ